MLIHFKECFIKDDLSVLCNVWQALDSLVCRPCKRAKVHMKPFLQIGRHGNACTSLIYNVPWAWGPICIIAWTLHHCTIAVWHHLQWGMNNTGSKAINWHLFWRRKSLGATGIKYARDAASISRHTILAMKDESPYEGSYTLMSQPYSKGRQYIGFYFEMSALSNNLFDCQCLWTLAG